MLTLPIFLLALGAGARLTRLVTDDYIARHLRLAVIRWRGWQSDSAFLVTCAWCLGFWMLAGTFALGYFYGDQPWFIWPAAALSASYLYGLTATHLDGKPVVPPVEGEDTDSDGSDSDVPTSEVPR